MPHSWGRHHGEVQAEGPRGAFGIWRGLHSKTEFLLLLIPAPRVWSEEVVGRFGECFLSDPGPQMAAKCPPRHGSVILP